jgi:hypothetical protein
VLDKLIRRIAEKLDEGRIPYMIIGGQAVLLYGRPRLTRDIDITLGIDVDRFSQVADVCTRLKFQPLPEKPSDFVRETNVFPTEDPESRIRVDFVFSFSEYERQAIERAEPVPMNGYPVRFASREDIIIHKIVAGRAIDMEDIKSILAKNRDAIHLEYVRHWLSQFGEHPEYSGLLDRLDELLSQ